MTSEPVNPEPSRSRLAYTCSYVPLEIIYAAGFIPERIIGRTDLCLHTDSDLWGNICPYVHSILKTWRDNRSKFTRIILTDSCDAMKKLYDILYLESEPVSLLCVPRQKDERAVEFFAKQLEALFRSLEPGCNLSALERAAKLYRKIRLLLEELRSLVGVEMTYGEYFDLKRVIYESDPEEAGPLLGDLLKKTGKQRPANGKAGQDEHRRKIPVAVSGSPLPGAAVFSIIEEAGFEIEVNDSCLDLRWDAGVNESIDSGGSIAGASASSPFYRLALLYLAKVPCARMFDRKDELNRLAGLYPERIKGIIQFRMPFCDLYGFDAVHLLRTIGKEAIVLIETDGSKQSEGQIKTRVQAFAEMISERNKAGGLKRVTGSDSFFCGLDIGSTTVDGVIISKEGDILGSGIVKTGANAGRTARALLTGMLEKAGLKEEDLAFIMTTGYGRENFSSAGGSVTEISCHARGVRHLLPGTAFVIDIGGQDAKVIKIDGDGKVKDFQMNDKCAAGDH